MSTLRPIPRHFDAGCPHEAAHRAIAAAVDESPARPRFVGVAGGGCGALVTAYLDLPFVAAPFGRGPSVARGLVAVRPEVVPLVYTGEGEATGEGLSDLLRAARADVGMVVVIVQSHGAADAGGTCGRAGVAGGGGGALDPAPLLAALGRVSAGASAGDPAALRAAFKKALAAAAEGGFEVVRVEGGCPGVGRDL